MKIQTKTRLLADFFWYWENYGTLRRTYNRREHIAILDKKVIAHANSLSGLEKKLSKKNLYRTPLKVSPESPTIYELFVEGKE